MSTELAHYTVADLEVMSRRVAESRLFPGITTPQAAFTLMLLCQSEGLHPAKALRMFHIIEGKPSMRADAMQAGFQAMGGVVRWGRSDAEHCEAHFVHPVHAPDPGAKIAITIEDMRKAGLAGKGNWLKWPASMLRARVISQGVRMVAPGVVVGIYTPEEVADMEPERPAKWIEPTPQTIPARHAPQAIEPPKPAGPETDPAPEPPPQGYDEWLKQRLATVNAAWADKWTDRATGEVPMDFKELGEFTALTSAVLEDAVLTEKIPSPRSDRHNDRMKAVRLLWGDDPKWVKAKVAGLLKALADDYTSLHAAVTVPPDDEGCDPDFPEDNQASGPGED